MRIPVDTNKADKRGVEVVDADIAPLDAGPAPIEHIMRLSRATMAAGVGGATVKDVPPSAETKSSRNPLRAGAAAARKAIAATAARDPVTSDGGRAVKLPQRAAISQKKAPTRRGKAKTKARTRK